MNKYTYQNRKTGKRIYSNIELHSEDLILITKINTIDKIKNLIQKNVL